MVCITSPRPTSFILSKGSPGEGKGQSASRMFAEAQSVQEIKHGGRPTVITGTASLESKRMRWGLLSSYLD